MKFIYIWTLSDLINNEYGFYTVEKMTKALCLSFAEIYIVVELRLSLIYIINNENTAIMGSKYTINN